MLKYFAVILLIVCILQATVWLSVANLLLFPIALVTLALFFFKEPESLEVV